MARQSISEFRAKTLLAKTLDQTYAGLELDAQSDWRADLTSLNANEHYVAKVDQGIKRRFKQGLVVLDVPPHMLPKTIAGLFARGFRYVLVEPYTKHDLSDERYLALSRNRAGEQLMYARSGGIDIEQQGQVSVQELSPQTGTSAEHELGLKPGTITKIHELFNTTHMGFLEINPLLQKDGQAIALDLAVEVDAAADAFVHEAWTPTDLRQAPVSPEEAAIAELDDRSPASFNLKLLNPHGQIFVLLSGGGASLALVDEICHQGFGPVLANYGEYSGGPTADEVSTYVTHVVQLLLTSPAHPKVLIIAGGVANFTDVRVTFTGIIKALTSYAPKLRAAGIKVYVRRGGPNAAAGLELMHQFLHAQDLLGLVSGPQLPLDELVAAATAHLKVESP